MTLRRKLFDSENHAYFVTFSCYRRKKLLDDDRAKAKLAYMHNNPVAAGLVPWPENWRFGSAGWYLLNRLVGVDLTPLG